MAALCAASFSVLISCQSDKNDRDDDGDKPVKVDPELVGIWTLIEEASHFQSGQYITKLKINEDGTGEVFYYDLNDLEFQFDYSVKFVFGEYNTLTFTIDGVTPKTEVVIPYRTDRNTLTLSFNGIYNVYEKTDEWGDYGITNIFVGSWESDDSYDKIYLNVEEYELFKFGSYGVYVDKDNTEHRTHLIQKANASPVYQDYDVFLVFENPVREGDCLKVYMPLDDAVRTLKPMDKWPFKTYDELPKNF